METNETILNRILKKLTENINVNMIDSEINGINMKLVFHRYLADLKRFNKDLTEKISLDNYKKLETIYPGVYYKTNLLEKDLYDKELNDMNARIKLVQSQDQTLEVRLKNIDTEHKALDTEMEAIKKVLEKNIESSFKTFA